MKNELIDSYIVDKSFENSNSDLVTIEVITNEKMFPIELNILDISVIRNVHDLVDLKNKNDQEYQITLNNGKVYYINQLQYDILINYLEPRDLSVTTYKKFLEEKENE